MFKQVQNQPNLRPEPQYSPTLYETQPAEGENVNKHPEKAMHSRPTWLLFLLSGLVGTCAVVVLLRVAPEFTSGMANCKPLELAKP